MSGKYRGSKYSYLSLNYCGICRLPKNQQKYIPILKWAKDNFYTPKQCRRLLKKGYLLGHKEKNRMFVMINPNFEGEI